MPHRTDARALSYLAVRLIGRSYAQKEKHNVESFILEMKHIMVPLVNVLNTVGKMGFFHHYTNFFSLFVPPPFFFSFSMWCPALFLF